MDGRRGGDEGEGTSLIAEPLDTLCSDVEVDDGSDSGQDVVGSSLRARLPQRAGAPVSMAEWQKGCCEFFKERKSYADLGHYIMESVKLLDSPLGHFIRSFCNPAQPTPAAEATFDRKGDLLPIHPSAVRPGQHGVTEQNLEWVQLSLSLINFNYCTGWSKPICVPMDTRLSANQCAALHEVARTVDDNILDADILPTLSEAKAALQSKKYDYSGNAVEYMQDLEADKVFPTWPRQGEAGIRCITEFLAGEA